MAIRFLTDYRGVLTQERYFTAGSIVDGLPLENQLVQEGRAVYVEPEKASASPATLPDDYRELQALAKRHGIPTRQSKDALIAALRKVL